MASWQRLRIGVAHILAGEHDHAPGDELGVLPARQHRGHVVDGGIWVAAAQRLDERRDGVVVGVAAIVSDRALLGGVVQIVERQGERCVRGGWGRAGGDGSRAPCCLEGVEGDTRIPARESGEECEAAWFERDTTLAETPLSIVEGGRDDALDDLRRQGLEAVELAARDERRVDLEVGVLGGRPDERDHAVLDGRQQGVLLRLVEAMDLIDEEDRARAGEGAGFARALDRGAHIRRPRVDRGELHQARARLGGDEARQRRLAGARRAEEDHAEKRAAGDGGAQHCAGSDEVILPDELREAAGPHARRQWRLGRDLFVAQGEEVHGLSVVPDAEARMRDAILRRVIIDASREPRLQFGDAEPFAIDRCEVRRDVARSTLTNVILDGGMLPLPVGARVTLWAGANVVFVGRAVDAACVLDLLSAESDDALPDNETI